MKRSPIGAVTALALHTINHFLQRNVKSVGLMACCLSLAACSSPAEVEPAEGPTPAPSAIANPITVSATATPAEVPSTQTPAPGRDPTPTWETSTITAAPTEAPPANPTPTNPPTATSPPEEEPLEFGASDAFQQNNSQESPFVDFSPIEGQWAGLIVETDEKGTGSWAEIFLSPGAEQGTRVGSVRYATQGSRIVVCRGRWLAIRAEDPVYTVSEQITSGASESGSGCPDGSVRLEHDPQSGTLKYEFTHYGGNPDWNAYGTLTRSGE